MAHSRNNRPVQGHEEYGYAYGQHDKKKGQRCWILDYLTLGRDLCSGMLLQILRVWSGRPVKYISDRYFGGVVGRRRHDRAKYSKTRWSIR